MDKIDENCSFALKFFAFATDVSLMFEERGRIFSVEEIQAVDILDRSMFFTGDGAGKIRVWKWSSEQKTE
ncbi:hypothetical protein Sjap_021987 [Stephania japonica]|uniref:Uncharacterized protein n=1 Tax=Stephania japonica TaxID=461633 RepID=A0AAP0EN20_9MAGN